MGIYMDYVRYKKIEKYTENWNAAKGSKLLSSLNSIKPLTWDEEIEVFHHSINERNLYKKRYPYELRDNFNINTSDSKDSLPKFKQRSFFDD